MRRTIAAALMMTLLLCSCKAEANAAQSALDIRSAMLASPLLELEATVRADYGDTVYDYTLQCHFTRNGPSTVTILEPELIAGVTASVSDGGSSLSFDGAELDTGKLPNAQLTPMGALPAIAESWCSGYISSSGYERYEGKDCLMVCCLCGYGSEEVEYRTWFLREGYAPVHGEIISGGETVVFMDFLSDEPLV